MSKNSLLKARNTWFFEVFTCQNHGFHRHFLPIHWYRHSCFPAMSARLRAPTRLPCLIFQFPRLWICLVPVLLKGQGVLPSHGTRNIWPMSKRSSNLGDYKLVVQSMYTACAILAVFYHRIPDELKQLKLCEDWTWPISSLVYPLKAWWFSIVMLCWFTRGYGILWNGCRLSWWDSSCWLSDGFELELKQFWRVLL